MKIRRFACSAFSLCVLMTSTLFANAANIPEDNRISEYAGETIQCQIVKCTDNNTPESSVISVTIPEGATKAQEDQIIQPPPLIKPATPTHMLPVTLWI